MNFKGRDIVSIKEFTREEIEYLLDKAKEFVEVANGTKTLETMKGKILATAFYEPSTRTRLSFETAMLRLGGRVVGFSEPSTTSMVKGESLADTIRMLSAYSDVIVIRNQFEGAARLAAEFTDKPVINAGDGAGQHPTQTLQDLFTINNEFNKIEGLNIALLGDLKYGRTVHSLAYALAKFKANLFFVSPQELKMPSEIVSEVSKLYKEPVISENLKDIISVLDVLYVTRIQKERFPVIEEYNKVAGAYRIDMETLKNSKKEMIIMHPLPRVTEISSEVDKTHHARYFQQAANGVPVRMCLLSAVLGSPFPSMVNG